MKFRAVMACAACALLIGACTSARDVEEAANANATGSGFTQSLHQEYVGLAKAELKEGDQADAKHFAMKAKEAATGKAVAPDDLKIRSVGGTAGKNLSDARVRLVSALNSPEAKRRPAVAAKAQGMFDCWMQEQEEGWQQKDIAACRQGFDKAMALLSAKQRGVAVKKANKPAKKPSGSPYTVFFKFDSAELTEKSQGALYDIMQDIRVHKPKSVHVVAHTDLVGDKAYNAKLSEKRAAGLQTLLKDAGAKVVTVEAMGASDPVVDTRKPNQPNRRAIIVFKK